MKTLIRTCLVAGIATSAFTLTACNDSSDVADVTPRKVDANEKPLAPNTHEAFSSMDGESGE